MRKININKKIVIIIVIVLLISYYLFYEKENEFEKIPDLNELETYEEIEEIQSEQVKEEKEIIVVHITGKVKIFYKHANNYKKIYRKTSRNSTAPPI